MHFWRVFSFIAVIGLVGFGLVRVATAEIASADAPTGPVELGKVLGAQSGDPESLVPVETYVGLPEETNAGQVYARLSVTVAPEDVALVFPDPNLGIGFFVRVFRATSIKVSDGGKTTDYKTFAKTVKELLAGKSIELGDDDKIEPAPDSPLSVDLAIRITRVEITQVKVKETIDYKQTKKDDGTIDRGVTKVSQKGKKGERVKTYELRRENGAEVARKLLKNEVSIEPVDEIVLVGTKEVVYGTGKATWFGAPAMTAAHNSLPKGTKVRVTGLSSGKSVEVTIIGGGIMGSAVIDLSPDAFSQLAPLGAGTIQVRITKP